MGQDRVCGLDEQMTEETANSRANLEVQLPRLPGALIGIWRKREIRGMKPGVKPDLH